MSDTVIQIHIRAAHSFNIELVKNILMIYEFNIMNPTEIRTNILF